MAAMIRVLLVDDHAILREGLRALLRFSAGVEVVGEARDGAEAVERVGELHPDIVLMDIGMPGMNGIEATRIIRQRYPQTRVLILTQHEERQYLLPLLQAGASGYVLKRALGVDLIAALRSVARGEAFLYPDVVTALVEEVQRQDAEPRENPVGLTPREREILKLIALGHRNPQIAAALFLSQKTVEWHRGNLMSKLGAHNTAALVRYAMRHGLIDETEDLDNPAMDASPLDE
jgi:DNA-binding NarL/FixJ family response regulator